MIYGDELVERMYSDYDEYYEDERYYSEYELDDLYERAFCEGYEYAQREFASVRLLKKNLNKAIRGAVDNNSKLVNTAAEKVGNTKMTAELKSKIIGKNGNGKLTKQADQAVNKMKKVDVQVPEKRIPSLGKPTITSVPGQPGKRKLSMSLKSSKSSKVTDLVIPAHTEKKAAITQNPGLSNNGRNLLSKL